MVGALFDTNILIDHLNGVAQAKAELERYESASISIITWMEVMVGAPADLHGPTLNFLERFSIVALDEPIAALAVILRRQHRIKLPDAVIWASAQNTGRLLVTRNIKDFPSDNPGVREPYSL